MKTKAIIILFTTILSSALTFAQGNGTLRGNIQDGDFGGPLVGATVIVVEKPGVGTVTDFDGNYSLSLEPGTYTVKFSFISFTTLTFSEVKITSGEVTRIDGTLQSSTEQLAEVQVTASAKRNTEAGLLIKMRNSPNVVDGLSSQTFRRIGDNDLSGAIKRVTGVTVEGGKYVYVRGLGDRYTKTTLNGMSIPGLDPDANAVQIDIFPTQVLENVAVYKSFTPNLYGDFSGGLVDVETKSFPDQRSGRISVGLSMVPGMNFNPDFILYDGGNFDWLGFDDGTRKLPFNSKTYIPQEPVAGQELEIVTRSFNPQLAAQSKFAAPNGSLSFLFGDQINKENGKTFGYNAVFSYNNNTVYYDKFVNNVFLKDNDKTVNELFKDESRIGVLASNQVQWSAFLSGSMKTENNTYSSILMHSQSGESSASQRKSSNFNQTQARLVEDILTYTQRSLSTWFLSGQHRVGKERRTILEWTNAATYSRVYDPDFRSTTLSVTTGDTTLNTGDGAGISRFWRDLNEVNENARFDATIPVDEKGNHKLKTGVNAVLKWRSFETLVYDHDRRDKSNVSGNPDWFLQPENIWTTGDRSGTYTIGNFEPANNFDARQNVFAGYVMGESALGLFKFTYGVRLEKAAMYYTGQDNAGLRIYNDEQTLDELNFLPAANVVYALNEDMNIRASASQTIARPSFKEKSIAQIYDPITKRTFVGNLDLNQTFVNNFDLRYEWYFTPAELFSVAGFYKTFDGHIEMVAFEIAPNNFKPRNSGNADVLGIEVEVRKGFLNSSSNFLRRMFIGGNITLVQSRVDMRSVNTGNNEETEYDLRLNNLREGETIDFYRPMAGQSPYAVNVNISYEIPEKQRAISLAYNVKGEQLTYIASGRIPDVYSVPFHSLDFNAYYSFGENYHSRITFGITNLIDDDRTLVYRSYGTTDEIFNQFYPGRQFRLKYTYSF